MNEQSHDNPGGSSEQRPGSRRGVLKATGQLIGFGAGIGLLGWCAREAFKEENREHLAKLGEAEPGPVALLLACSLLTVLLNGLIFWVVLRPEKRIPLMGTLATNALAMMLAYLPFKISVLARVTLHNRRDGVPLLTIAAWFGALGVLMLVALGPVSIASMWRKEIDPWWWLATGLGTACCLAGTLGFARLLAGDRGLARLHALSSRLGLRFVDNAVRTRAFARLHAAFGMLAHPGAVLWATLLRLLDVGTLALRFVLAASILGVTLEWEHAVLFASSYFLIGVLSPFGMLGTREAGTLGAAHALGIAGSVEALEVIILLVSATESLAFLFAGSAGGVWVRPDRLLRGKNSQSEGTPHPGGPAED